MEGNQNKQNLENRGRPKTRSGQKLNKSYNEELTESSQSVTENENSTPNSQKRSLSAQSAKGVNKLRSSKNLVAEANQYENDQHIKHDGVDEDVPPGEDDFESNYESDFEDEDEKDDQGPEPNSQNSSHASSQMNRSRSLSGDNQATTEASSTPQKLPMNKQKGKRKSNYQCESEQTTPSSVVTFKRSRYADYQQEYAANPEFRQFMDGMVDERIQQNERQSKYGHQAKKNWERCNQGRFFANTSSLVVKSPSDSTLYTPALKQGLVDNQVINRISNFVDNIRLEAQHNSPNMRRNQQQVSPRIMNCDDSADSNGEISDDDQKTKSEGSVSEAEAQLMEESSLHRASAYRRHSHERRSQSHSYRRGCSREHHHHRDRDDHDRHRHGHRQESSESRSRSRSRRRKSRKHTPRPWETMKNNRACDVVDKILIDAECKRANLIAPKGMSELDHRELMRMLDNDDDFFHISCHLDDNVKQKIEQGEFY